MLLHSTSRVHFVGHSNFYFLYPFLISFVLQIVNPLFRTLVKTRFIILHFIKNFIPLRQNWSPYSRYYTLIIKGILTPTYFKIEISKSKVDFLIQPQFIPIFHTFPPISPFLPWQTKSILIISLKLLVFAVFPWFIGFSCRLQSPLVLGILQSKLAYLLPQK